jgi:hypothetical protein
MRFRHFFFFLTIGLGATQSAAFEMPHVPGWKGATDVERYSPETVWKAINGAADLYIAFGFRELTLAEYERKEVLFSVQVFEQATPLGAYGVFLKQSPNESRTLSLGAAAMAAPPYQCVLVKGPYYVKADATRGKTSIEDCQHLLALFAKAIPGGNELPKEMTLLPKKDQIVRSLGYTKTSLLGLSEMGNAVHANYPQKSRSPYQLFLLLPDLGKPDPFAALGGKWTVGSKGKFPWRSRKIPYQGDVVVASLPFGVFGVAGASDIPAALGILEALYQEKQPGIR